MPNVMHGKLHATGDEKHETEQQILFYFILGYVLIKAYIQCIWKVFRPLDLFHILLC